MANYRGGAGEGAGAGEVQPPPGGSPLESGSPVLRRQTNRLAVGRSECDDDDHDLSSLLIHRRVARPPYPQTIHYYNSSSLRPPDAIRSSAHPTAAVALPPPSPFHRPAASPRSPGVTVWRPRRGTRRRRSRNLAFMSPTEPNINQPVFIRS